MQNYAFNKANTDRLNDIMFIMSFILSIRHGDQRFIHYY